MPASLAHARLQCMPVSILHFILAAGLLARRNREYARILPRALIGRMEIEPTIFMPTPAYHRSARVRAQIYARLFRHRSARCMVFGPLPLGSPATSLQYAPELKNYCTEMAALFVLIVIATAFLEIEYSFSFYLRYFRRQALMRGGGLRLADDTPLFTSSISSPPRRIMASLVCFIAHDAPHARHAARLSHQLLLREARHQRPFPVDWSLGSAGQRPASA